MQKHRKSHQIQHSKASVIIYKDVFITILYNSRLSISQFFKTKPNKIYFVFNYFCLEICLVLTLFYNHKLNVLSHAINTSLATMFQLPLHRFCKHSFKSKFNPISLNFFKMDAINRCFEVFTKNNLMRASCLKLKLLFNLALSNKYFGFFKLS